ncbi:MAG: WecB/TagA/CpsF family glycosyltransferase [Candidatus Dojkabacteria bacterium]|nr:WecB/TagA/CpsF family glycosyltransferase [Candidatus Dojkabacteria bacterium]MDQ7021479.1 WecB/TagA/CpsF family glycosyltransferase [Candidatus Dojkabacteria bacterium]
MEEKKLLGIKINNLTKDEFISEVDRLIKDKRPSYVVTPYSEFIINAQKDEDFKKVINGSDISIADGFGISLGLKYMSLSGVYKPMIKCLLGAIFNKKFFKDEIKEKLSGSEIIYDVSKLAEDNKYKVFLLGGFDFGEGNTGELTKNKLEGLYPNINIVGLYSGSADISEEDEIINIVNKADPDILFMAYGPIKQEKWANRNKEKLKPMVTFCLGGTFDYVSGSKRKVPKIISNFGLEGILRPFFSERGNPKMIWKRFKRAWGGIIKFLILLMKSK